MSEQNVEIVGVIYERFARGETAEMMEHLHPEIDWLINAAAPEAGTHRGHEGVNAWLADVEENLSEFRIVPGELLDAGDAVVCPVRIVVRGKASGAEADLRETHVWTLGDALVTEMRVYSDHAEALEAAGLSE
jgi:ketosteroid isomerase-like protein